MEICGKPNAKVSVLTNPRLQGYEHAKRYLQEEAPTAYHHVDLVLFLPDSDGKDRGAELTALEATAQGKGLRLLCCAAVEEVETWLLSGHVEKLQMNWNSIRNDVSVKENIFRPFLSQYGDADAAGDGRKELMEEGLRSFQGVLQRCPELDSLRERISAFLGDA
ncbi:MAG TPA: hypothetical protein VGJ89_08440 [Geothrix sp.]|jgi:hypothetical protein